MTYGTFCPRRDRSLVYRLVGRSVHISGTCLLIFAQDVMQNNAPVALKLMHNEEEWLREQDMRKLANGDPLDSTHVVQLLKPTQQPANLDGSTQLYSTLLNSILSNSARRYRVGVAS